MLLLLLLYLCHLASKPSYIILAPARPLLQREAPLTETPSLRLLFAATLHLKSNQTLREIKTVFTKASIQLLSLSLPLRLVCFGGVAVKPSADDESTLPYTFSGRLL